MPKSARIVIIVVVVLIVVVAIAFIIGRKPRQVNQTVGAKELTVWGVADAENDIFSFFADVTTLTGANIKYRQIPEDEYEATLLEALASGTGPDIFALHNTWVPKHANKLAAAPAELINLRLLQEGFVEVVSEDLVSEGKVYALPFYMDTVGLFYNRDFFNSAAIVRPPQTWEEFVEDVLTLTIKDSQNKINRAGAAMGTARNIEFAPELLQLLIMQSGGKMVDPLSKSALFAEGVVTGNEQSRPGLSALQFYTDFASPAKEIYTWNDLQSDDVDAFIQGRTAMIFSTANTIKELKERSPQLRFGVAGVPQTEGATLKIAYPDYWAFAVNRWSSKAADAWRVIWMTAAGDTVKKYLETTGRVSARRDILGEQIKDPLIGPFAEQALIAKGWYQIDHEAIDEIFRVMIDSVVKGQDKPSDALRKASEKVTALIKK